MTLSKSEKDRIKKERKIWEKKLKHHKFELLPNSVWDKHLLKYLCRTEQFLLSSTCKHCYSKCSIDTFVISQQFDFDNYYWRENFFNFIDPSQDSTLLINENKFEMLTLTQKRQLKYYIKFWDKFIVERQDRKLQRDKNLEENHDDDDDKKDDNQQQESAEKDEESENENNNKEEEEKPVKNEEVELEIEEDKDKNKKKDKGKDDDDKEEKKSDDLEDEEEEDLYAEDNFEYDDDRPRGQVLLEKYRADYEFKIDSLAEDALLHIAIPTDIEQLLIRDCKNKNGELAHWLSSVLCYIPSICPIDWFGLENNNFQDRDIHRICAGLLNRVEQSGLIGLSLSNNTNISDRCISVLLKTISKKCHHLQFLKLNNCTKLTNKTCQHILEFFSKTYNDDKIQLNYIDLSNNNKINDKGISILNQIYLHQQYTPYNVVVRFYCAGTQWNNIQEDWSKNIILKPPKRR